MNTSRVWVIGCALAALLAGTADAAVIHVSAATGNDANDGLSWAAAKQSVQAGLNAAAARDEVWVAAGTYVEHIMLRIGVALYGGFAGTETELAQRDWKANETILDGNGTFCVVWLLRNAAESTRIDGFTIRNGNGMVSGSYSYGGGIYCSESSPTIANNTITECEASWGAGIYCGDSSPIITNNTITENIASDRGGGIYCSFSSPMITNNTITGNIASHSGAGIYCFYASSTIADNTIAGNTASSSGGGICCGNGSSPTITGNAILRNAAGSGGGIACESFSYTLYTTVSDNVIIGNDATYGGGIHCQANSPAMVANNRITGNDAHIGGGIYCHNDDTTIANTVITANRASYGGGGIACISCSPTIANDTITGNTAVDFGGGIYCMGSSPTIANTIVAFNNTGIHYASALTMLVHNCVFGNTAGNYTGLTDKTGTYGNISVDPMLADTGYGNVHIQPDSPCRDAGNDGHVQAGWLDMDGEARSQGASVDIGADESDGTVWPGGPYGVVRVGPDGNDANDGSSWAQAKRTVQAGIDAASLLGGEAWVAAGTYPERITLLPYAYVYGGFTGNEDGRDQRAWTNNVTILDGQQSGSVVTARAGACAIDGFTIRNGSSENGAGIYCGPGSFPTIANDTITANSASQDGGGIYCVESFPTIAGNTITGNTATDHGGGIYCHSATPTLDRNTIMGNETAQGGGIYCGNCAPLITNSTIATNEAVYGGGIYCGGASVTIANNTVAGNNASTHGGAIYCVFASPTLANTIIAFNSSGIYKTGMGTLTPKCNCVFGNTAYDYMNITNPTGTNGNLSTDPLFVRMPDAGPDGQWDTADDDWGDLHLKAVSPCVDAGTNAAVPAGIMTDGDGHPRIADGNANGSAIVDMGTYEYPAIPPDFDFDGDADIDDFALFQICFNGPNRSPAAAGCSGPDMDDDGDVDLADFGLFAACFNGPNRSPACE